MPQRQLAASELRHLMPADPGTSAHCHRVAALCREIGLQLHLSAHSLVVLDHAALLHHTTPIIFSPAALDRLARDLAPHQPELSGKRRQENLLPDDLAAILHSFYSGPCLQPDRNTRLLAEILTVCDLVDQQLESLSWDPRPIRTLWKELEDLRDLASAAVWRAAWACFEEPFGLAPGAADLPVNGLVVKDLLISLRTNPDCDVDFLARLANRDPVLAGNVMRTANSAWFARRKPVRSVLEAITYIGADAGRNVILALALKPLYASSRLAALWRHAVAMAGFCEILAQAAPFASPAEGLLLGLMHDVGRIALERRSADASRTMERLSEKGCPPVFAEQLLFGVDHGEAGARILEAWEFPPDLIEAVRYHHHPAEADSPGAAALYLAEFWAETEEDLPSARHLTSSFRRLGASFETLSQVSLGRSGFADLLRAA